MNGLQFQNLYCLFDTPATNGAHINNRFCTGGGPSNNANNWTGSGGGIEYDSWNGTNWINLFKVFGQNGSGSITATAATSFGSNVSVSGATNLAGTLTASSGAHVAGGLTASMVNSTIYGRWSYVHYAKWRVDGGSNCGDKYREKPDDLVGAWRLSGNGDNGRAGQWNVRECTRVGRHDNGSECANGGHGPLDGAFKPDRRCVFTWEYDPYRGLYL